MQKEKGLMNTFIESFKKGNLKHISAVQTLRDENKNL